MIATARDIGPHLFMTYSAAIQFLYHLRWFGAKFGLNNTFRLAALAGNPQDKLRFIHVAGTNGKGSTCAMLESIYRAAGFRVGLFTSPHLVAFGERIQVNRRSISDPEVASLVGNMQRLLDQGWGTGGAPAIDALDTTHSDDLALKAVPAGEQHPTFFEAVTVMALQYFLAQECDLVIWETGLGGRLDATNIVTPLASVITNIQYDHQNYLGETLPSIAKEKAGIIKPNIPVITGTDAPEALRVIEEVARRQNAPLTIVPPTATREHPLSKLTLPLLGEHQRMNAAVALATVRTLLPTLAVDEAAIAGGLSQVDWPGRLQLVNRPPQKILLDGAHNASGAEMLAAALERFFPAARPALVLGILRDKNWPQMCRILAPRASRIVLVPVHNERTAEPHGLAEICKATNPSVEVLECLSLSAALELTRTDPFVTIAGSLYLVGEAMELLGISAVKPNNERGLNEWTNVERVPGNTCEVP